MASSEGLRRNSGARNTDSPLAPPDTEGLPLSARSRLAAELRQRRIDHGRRTYSEIVRRANERSSSFSFSKSSVGDWLTGKSVPDPVGKLSVLLQAMTGSENLDADLRRLHRQAIQEGRASGHRRGAPSPEAPPVAPTHLPRLDAVHYVDVDRLYDLALAHDSPIDVPDLDWNHRRGPGHVKFRRVLINELDTIALRAKRFTLGLDLRALQSGDLLIFDTQVRTRNGVGPYERP